MIRRNLYILIVLSGFFFTSCKRHRGFEVKDFSPIVNPAYSGQNTRTIYLDYTGAIDSGFVIPSVRQTPGGKFIFRFSVKNDSDISHKFFYKIYYQDESYKFPDTFMVKGHAVEDSLAAENFYGSWEETSAGFKQTKEIPADDDFHTVSDSFRIVGNPRNEQKYFGHYDFIEITEKEIEHKEKTIESDSNWIRDIRAKAKKEHRTVEEQVYLDAKWVINDDKKKVILNKRWQRNPRVGKYSFLLVVTLAEKSGENHIPEYISDISKMNGDKFSSPYFYFLYGNGSKLPGTKVLTSADTLKVIAKPDLGKGIYVLKKFFNGDSLNPTFFRYDCGNSARLYTEAPFRQYLNQFDTTEKINNIRVSADVSGNDYTVADYRRNSFPPASKLVKVPLSDARCPCETVFSDSAEHLLKLVTPATPKGKWRKENVGVRSRNGFTYGKYYFKVKMPSLLNKSNLWTGLTDAIWLIYQEDAPWNYRRYSASGYIPKSDNSATPERRHQLAYSEIDIEMLKAAHFWTPSSYHTGTKVIPQETPADSGNIMVTSTNWDLASRDVKRFICGADSINYMGKYYGIHRWDDFYKALTSKDAESNNELFNRPYYWFEIDWEPTEITWRIGPEKNQMKAIGYVNNTVSSIPDNQMVITFTQEYHFSKWWPGLPFLQELIPFPAKDVTGEIYEIDIE